MTGREVKKLSDEELGVELGNLRAKLFKLRSQAVTEKIEDTSQFGKVRRDIARVRTEIRARELVKA